MSVATAPRNILQIQSRRIFNFGLSLARFSVKKIFGDPKPQKILINPSIDKVEDLGDILNRIAWYIPNPKVNVYIPYKQKMLDKFKVNNINVPQSQHQYFDVVPPQVKLITEKQSKLIKADIMFLRNWKYIIKHILRLQKIQIIDPWYYSEQECVAWANFYYQSLFDHESEIIKEQSKRNYAQLLKSVKGFKRAYIYTTGPSIDCVHEFEFEAESFKIICNSMVKNQVFLEHIRPQLLVFADPVFHFSPCLYSYEFRKFALKAIERCNMFCMVPETKAGLLLAHYPHLADRLIGIPHQAAETWNFPTPERFYIKGSNNIMTLYMIPVASAIAREVCILGADGRQKGEKYFWKHSSQNQFDELMQTVVDTHPSFFRDRIYTDYYKKHCQVVESQIEFGEKRGIIYRTLTPSYIPALAKRYEDKS